MTTEDIVKHILSKHPEISKEEILEKLRNEKKKMNDLISDEVLLRKIAAEFGVEISKKILTPTLLIEHLITGLNDVSVVGRIVAVFPPKVFRGRKSGKIASLLIVDKTSILRVILWNDKTDYVKSGQVKSGEIIRISHGYTRKGYRGKIELHLGDRGEIKINPENVKTEDYPTIRNFATMVSEVTSKHKNKRVNLIGVVKKLFPVSSFERKDSSHGRVMRFELTDETGEIPVVVWNEKVDYLEERIRKGTELRLIDATVKKAMGAGLEIHVNAWTYVEILKLLEEEKKIADLKLGLRHVKVKGEVVSQPINREVKTSEGRIVKLALFELEDETGRIWISAWREHAKAASNLNLGQKVTIRDVYVKKGFGDQLELSTTNTSSFSCTPS